MKILGSSLGEIRRVPETQQSGVMPFFQEVCPQLTLL